MDLHARYPALSDLRLRAQRRLPHFVWEFVDSGTGNDLAKARNRLALDEITFMPSILHGESKPDVTMRFLGHPYNLPVGVAPVGMSGLVWPDAERHLAQMAATEGLPYCLSTVASQRPEDVADVIGEHAWFQLYPPRDPDVRQDIVKRAKVVGFKVLVMTVDLPAGSRRERQVRSGLTQPPKLSPRILAQIALRPAWALGMARVGMPRMRLVDDYSPPTKGLPSNNHAGYLLRTAPDWDYLRWVRNAWDGPMVVKGVLDPDDAALLEDEGIDALWVSNHAGRQFDAAPPAITQLPKIRDACTLPLVMDSGIEGGLDVLRAVALGADMVMMGRGWHYALGALGSAGPSHLADILRKDLESNMGQMGLSRLDQVRDRLLPYRAG